MFSARDSLRFELFTAMADQVQDRIDRGTLDIGFLLEPVHVDKCVFIRLPVKERLEALLRSDDPLSEKDSIEPEDLLGFPVVLLMRKELKQNTRNILGTVYDRFDALAVSMSSIMSHC